MRLGSKGIICERYVEGPTNCKPAATSRFFRLLNELPVIDPCIYAQIFGIAMGQTLQLTRRKCMANGCPTSKKTILARDFRFFTAVLSEMNLGNDVTGEA